MGKAGRWLRSFLTGKKAKDKGKEADTQSLSSACHALPTPSAKEKRRWSFRRPAPPSGKHASASGQGQLTSTSSHCFSVVVQDQHAVAVPEAAIVAVLPASKEAAAVKIQSAFRSYLARMALCALRGMVKLQAMVRGQLVRRQANMTLRRIQALVSAQRRARAERVRLLDGDKSLTRTPRTSRRSPQHHRSGKPRESADRGSEENEKIVEVDNGGGAGGARARRSSCCSTPGQKVSPTTSSALTDASARSFSGRFDEHSVSVSAASEAISGRHWPAPPLFPNYMANTESSRARARSQSAPRHRRATAASEAANSPSPSCELLSSGSGRRRRASLDPRDLAGARVAGRDGARQRVRVVERCRDVGHRGAHRANENGSLDTGVRARG